MKNGRKLGEQVELGLGLLRILRKPGETFTTADIAAWCGCQRQNIEQIERKAMKRVRARLRREGVAL